MPRVIKVTIPDLVQYDEWKGDVDGQQIMTLIEKPPSNRLLLDINLTKLPIEDSGAVVTPPTTPPIEYAWYHTIVSLNVRSQPNLSLPPVEPISPLAINTNLELSPPVTPAIMQQLGLTYTIQGGYEWRHMKNGNFVASKSGTVNNVAIGQATTPTTPPPSTSSNLKTVSVDGKLRVAIKGTSRPIENFVDIRGLAYCGLSRVNGTSQDDIVRLLDAAKALGVRLIRFYTAYDGISAEDSANRVKFVLDRMQERGILGILTLNDSIGSGFHVAGDQSYRKDMPMGHLGHTYYTNQAYRGNYATWVTVLLNLVGKHPAIGSFDISNETGGYGFATGQPIPPEVTTAIRAYGAFAVNLIRSKSPHWINWGIINAAHVGCDTPAEAEAFYKGLGLNVLGVHLYDEHGDDFWQQEARALSIDVPTARKLGLPIWIDEIGVNFVGNNRRSDYAAAIERYKSWSAGNGWWGFNPLSAGANLSDSLGFSVHLSDYNDLVSLMKGYL